MCVCVCVCVWERERLSFQPWPRACSPFQPVTNCLSSNHHEEVILTQTTVVMALDSSYKSDNYINGASVFMILLTLVLTSQWEQTLLYPVNHTTPLDPVLSRCFFFFALLVFVFLWTASTAWTGSWRSCVTSHVCDLVTRDLLSLIIM